MINKSETKSNVGKDGLDSEIQLDPLFVSVKSDDKTFSVMFTTISGKMTEFSFVRHLILVLLCMWSFAMQDSTVLCSADKTRFSVAPFGGIFHLAVRMLSCFLFTALLPQVTCSQAASAVPAAVAPVPRQQRALRSAAAMSGGRRAQPLLAPQAVAATIAASSASRRTMRARL